MKYLILAALAAASIIAAKPTTAIAQPTIAPSSSIESDDADGTNILWGDAFGAAAATWRNWLFVGAPRETAFRNGADMEDGAVYIYKRDASGAYAFQQKLTIAGNSVQFGDRFGGGIEAEAGWLFVAAANDPDFPGLVDPRAGIDYPDPFTNAGQVHVYRLNAGAGTWHFFQTLIAPEPRSNGAFGARTQASHVALRRDGRVAAIGEPNNFADGVGQIHIYRFIKRHRSRRGAWRHIQTIDSPSGHRGFGDNVVFANKEYLLAAATETSEDGITAQGFAYVFRAKGAFGRFFDLPDQTIAGAVVAVADCSIGGPVTFGNFGLDAGGGVVAISDPCVAGSAGAFAGAVKVFRIVGGPLPLMLEATIEGDAPNLYFGANLFGARHAIAINRAGNRMLIGTPLFPDNSFLTEGAEVRVYADGPGGWLAESLLTTPTPATALFRQFGDTVFFTDNETALVRESNFLDPVVSGFKGQMFFYDLTP